MPKPREVKKYGSTKDALPSSPPSAEEVLRQHTNADTDVRNESIHHTNGYNAGQSAPGPHNHRNGDGAEILPDIIITGSRTDGTAVQSIIAALVQMGAKDQTTT